MVGAGTRGPSDSAGMLRIFPLRIWVLGKEQIRFQFQNQRPSAVSPGQWRLVRQPRPVAALEIPWYNAFPEIPISNFHTMVGVNVFCPRCNGASTC